MQFKDLFTLKNIRNLFVIVIVVFLILPLMVPEKETVSVLKKETIAEREESPLPIFPRENIIERYKKQFKKLYLGEFSDATQTPQDTAEETENVRAATDDLSALDLFFSDDYIGEDDLLFVNSGNSNEFIDDKVNLQKGTVETSDGLIIEPTQEGYYYKGTFYKNGTYPKEANKTTIEGAINRYHTKVAQHLGKKALYYADENGKLTVDYVDKLPNEISTDIDTYLAQNTFKDTKKEFAKDASLYAKASNYGDSDYDKYRGVHINGLNSRMGGNKNITNSDIALASLYDMHAAYDLASKKLKEGTLGLDLNLNNSVNNPTNNAAAISEALATTDIAVADRPGEVNIGSFCHGDECKEAYRIAPIIKRGNSDLDSSDLKAFYSSFCKSDDPCPTLKAYQSSDNIPLEGDYNDPKDIDNLRKAIGKSDKDIVEISFIHMDYKAYINLLTKLKNENLRNINGDPVKVRFRSFNPRNTDTTSTFGEKMISAFEHNLRKDLPEETIHGIVDEYNQIDKKHKDKIDNDLSLSSSKELYKEMLGLDVGDIPVAIVEKSPDPKKKDTYVVNSFTVPNAYKTVIPGWEQYIPKNAPPTAYPSYEVSKDVLLDLPQNTALVLIGSHGTKDLKFKNRKHVPTIPQKTIKSYYPKDVDRTKHVITDAQFSVITESIRQVGQGNNPK